MWQVTGRPFDSGRFTPFQPADVLYAYDGPRVFTLVDADGELNLAYWSDGDGATDRYVVVPTTAADVELLRNGGVTVFDALAQPRCWTCDVAMNGTIVRCDRVDFAAIPRDALPMFDTLLLPDLEASRAPDSAVAEPVTAEGRIRELDRDRLSFDLRDTGTDTAAQTFVFDAAMLDEVVRTLAEQVRVRVAGLRLPGKRVAYASALSRL